MDMLEPLHDLLSPTKLPSVPEEYHPSDDLYRSLNVNYEDVSQSSFYQQATNAGINASSTIPSVSSNNVEEKFYLKSDPDQPLQLSMQQETNCKVGYRNNVGYHNANVNSVYNQNSNSNYNPYSSQNYHQPAQQQAHHPDGIVNYSHQSSVKNVSSSVPINYNSNSMIPNHHYGSYESTSAYNASTGSVQSAYSPSTSSNYKILSTSRSSRSGSLSMNNEEEMFAIPKLSQRGRSRSGSSLLNSQNRYLPSDQSNSDSVTSSTLLTQLLTSNRHYGYHGNYQLANCSSGSTSNYGSAMVCNSRTCCTINGHREVAHCAALLGRRSRTPDHILSSNSNPVGYCKPRTPIASSQSYSDGSLINLSNNQREETAAERGYYPVDSANTSANCSSSLALNCSRRLSQCTSRGPYDKYSANSPTYLGQNRTASVSSCRSSNMPSSPSPNSPFIFNATHQSNSVVEMSPSSSGTMLVANNTSSSSSPKLPSSPSTSESLSLSPLTVSSPIRTTPSSPTTKSSSSTPYKEHRRVCHINAEQKRRCNIKNGFDTLHMLIPHLIQNPNTKMSKAAMLQKGAEYIRQLRSERGALREEIESLKQQVESLNSAISNCQSLLPATGAPISRHKANKMREMFDEYVKERTKQNWKFWILSIICEPLLASFNSTVSTASVEELFRTTIQWAEQYCSLVDLRPIVLNALRHLCTSTEILTNPNQLPEEAKNVVFNTSRSTSKS